MYTPISEVWNVTFWLSASHANGELAPWIATYSSSIRYLAIITNDCSASAEPMISLFSFTSHLAGLTEITGSGIATYADNCTCTLSAPLALSVAVALYKPAVLAVILITSLPSLISAAKFSAFAPVTSASNATFWSTEAAISFSTPVLASASITLPQSMDSAATVITGFGMAVALRATVLSSAAGALSVAIALYSPATAGSIWKVTASLPSAILASNLSASVPLTARDISTPPSTVASIASALPARTSA